ncbi:tRNA (adenosine(37)-N6)-threonylcarbamoyltransferase complex transferase subunit TsaD [bacterium]|nr:tRNA (adenosine(37)-N6)-threonylcarbamoyltransferase complex transferase subunit TsaD [bacterium]
MADRPYILGIESSCDETAAALVTREGRVRVSAVASQVDLHAHFGGVVPEVAARMHIQACLPLVEEAMDDAGATWDDIEAIAVTSGPGLIGCLLVGLETAKTLSWLRDKPLIPVHHLAGHLYSIHLMPPAGAHRLMDKGANKPVLPLEPDDTEKIAATDRAELEIGRPQYPYVGLIVSGGHTSLVWVESPTRITTVAQTRDDAVGEAYDKVARVAGLGYPGGPIIDKLATQGRPDAFTFTPPMLRRDRPDFSFSGLKTAVGREFEKLRAQHPDGLPDQIIRDVCAGFQKAAVEALIGKALDACAEHGSRDLVISGGVACNRGLRERARQASADRKMLRIWFPHPSLCTDNAAMIAGAGWNFKPLPRPSALELNARATWPIDAIA